ncbi:sulfite exporter TauE/SafE family protein [Haloimpatiens massiliensis]|uniref:sulfite exporter TauE/SafE family protein n=1 Tax=Haloimpatiens massiliensis TaxID=1658110 RepID=UPI000C84308B|nr:sulfite exporter TauE/SafE family protein [Haloimpatiens massiliensis]
MIGIYFLISLLSTTVGAMAGLGGGVIIKPVLDLLGNYSLSVISVLSSITVFSMAVVSIIKQIKYKVAIQYKKTVLIGIGSVLGGLIGEKILRIVLGVVDKNFVIIIQNGILAFLLINIYIYMNKRNKFKSYHLENLIGCVLIGLLLGIIASFLSIGGGPINVCIFTIFFSMNTKEAAVNSIITILFSQCSKITTIFFTTGFSNLDLSMLPFMIIGGISGGIIGSRFNKVFSGNVILVVFNVVVILLILLNIYNMVSMINIINT